MFSFDSAPTTAAPGARLIKGERDVAWWKSMLALAFGGWWVFQGLQTIGSETGSPVFAFVMAAVFAVVAFIPSYTQARRAVWVDDAGISWRSAFGSDHAPWSDVVDLEVGTGGSWLSGKRGHPVNLRIGRAMVVTHKMPLFHSSPNLAGRTAGTMKSFAPDGIDLRNTTTQSRSTNNFIQ